MKLRRTYIVNKKFQYLFIARHLALLLFAFGLIFATVKLWEKRQVDQGFLLRPPENSRLLAWAKEHNVGVDSAEFAREIIRQAQVYTVFDLLWKPLAAILALNVIILIIANVYYSNRIAGPLYRMKETLERKLSGGEVAPIRFRRNDEFQELADVINRALDLKEPK